MGSRRGFICRMKVGSLSADSMSVSHLNRLKQRNSLGAARDGQSYAVVHCTGYIKNWPPTGKCGIISYQIITIAFEEAVVKYLISVI